MVAGAAEKEVQALPKAALMLATPEVCVCLCVYVGMCVNVSMCVGCQCIGMRVWRCGHQWGVDCTGRSVSGHVCHV